MALPDLSDFRVDDHSLGSGLQADMGMGAFNPVHSASAGSSASPTSNNTPGASNTPDAHLNPDEVSHDASSKSPALSSLDFKVRKRERNTAAARRYRQKRQDRIKELEEALAEVTKERDELRLRLARQEAQTATLRDLMGMSASATNRTGLGG
ncbi:hypothetical protein RB598_009388 [Gaeumannomyces tritici]